MTMKDLMKSRLHVRMLEEEVEKPLNVHRWRALEVRLNRQSYGYDNSSFLTKVSLVYN